MRLPGPIVRFVILFAVVSQSDVVAVDVDGVVAASQGSKRGGGVSYLAHLGRSCIWSDAHLERKTKCGEVGRSGIVNINR